MIDTILYFAEIKRCAICDPRNKNFVYTMPGKDASDMNTIVTVNLSSCFNVLKNNKLDPFVFYIELISRVFNVTRFLGHLLDVEYHGNISTNSKANVNVLRVSYEECMKDTTESVSNEKCLNICNSMKIYHGNILMSQTYDVEYAVYVLSTLTEQMAFKINAEKNINEYVFNRIENLTLQENDNNMPNFKCFYQKLLSIGPNMCTAEIKYSNNSGIDYWKYLNHSKTKYENRIKVNKNLSFIEDTKDPIEEIANPSLDESNHYKISSYEIILLFVGWLMCY